ncbi:MAG: ribosome recycling factor [Bacteroidetes bacterium]|jgi:ribosome recycling factor|nr:ribosome recycling factor [Bacteroidota bacterium]MDA1019315.1 ribosome recycling factor [Bacteroidota bacterium]|tara:strand:- start:33671 stop:34222 length:552 start_codon:yes stop_codon:yes gene_type:complete
MEEIEFIIEACEESMDSSIKYLEKALLNIRAGKASPSMLASVKLDYYGSLTSLSQISNINTPDAQTISVQPWEKDKLLDIEKAIMVANLGFNPMNNGESIIITIPPLTEERRRELVKIAKTEIEDAKISIRNSRKEANNEIKKSEVSLDQKSLSEKSIQDLTDKSISKIDQIYLIKEKEILSV